MTLALVAGAVSVIAVALLLRPFRTRERAARPAGPAAATDPGDLRTRLLRQVRALDVDLAAGTLSAEQHAVRRRALEAQLAPLLRRDPAARPAGTPRRSRWIRRGVSLLAAASAVAAIGVVLHDTVEPRSAAPAAPPTAAAAAPRPDGAFATLPTSSQLGAVDAAVKQVRRQPRSVGAHLALAHAYTAAGQPQLATVEYLAATHLAPGNAEANTALALVAFRSGSAEQAKAMVDRALRTRPGYPEALYVRGLVLAMGLERPQAAARDFRAYLDAAPYGSHRTSVETLLTLLEKEGR